jgi:DNA-directed RNA polymerase subunit E'/Rpb7
VHHAIDSPDQEGVFCTSGPLSLFISPKMGLPSDYEYDSANGLPCFYSNSEQGQIRVGSAMRVKILGVRISSDKMVRSRARSCFTTIVFSMLKHCKSTNDAAFFNLFLTLQQSGVGSINENFLGLIQ